MSPVTIISVSNKMASCPVLLLRNYLVSGSVIDNDTVDAYCDAIRTRVPTRTQRLRLYKKYMLYAHAARRDDLRLYKFLFEDAIGWGLFRRRCVRIMTRECLFNHSLKVLNALLCDNPNLRIPKDSLCIGLYKHRMSQKTFIHYIALGASVNAVYRTAFPSVYKLNKTVRELAIEIGDQCTLDLLECIYNP